MASKRQRRRRDERRLQHQREARTTGVPGAYKGPPPPSAVRQRKRPLPKRVIRLMGRKLRPERY